MCEVARCGLTRGWSGPARNQLASAERWWAPAAQPQDVRPLPRMIRRSAIALLFAAVSSSAVAQGPPIAGTYSDLAYDQRSGDLLGTEVHIVYSFRGYFVVMQCAAGVPAVMPAKVAGDRLEFT